MNRREGLSFKDAIQEAVSEIDSAESDLAPSAVELDIESDGEGTEQPVVERDEQSGLFDRMFVEKQDETEGAPDEDSLTFTVDGEQLTIADLKAGYLRQADYTRKTQELSNFRKEHENAIVLWKSLEEKPQETIRALWARVAQGQTPVQTEPKTPEDLETIIAQRVEEALVNDPRYIEVQKDKALQWAHSVLDEIEGENDVTLDDRDRIRVLERAGELQTEDLRYAFFTLDQERRKFEAQQRNAEANSSVSGLPTPQGESSDAKPRSFRSVREALDDTLAEAGVSRDTVFIT